ncbi:unnamed protein product [Plutella xylostella]|uniref:(diamondback moth) hypothetical protein n=1 Tax=Plutella xylostella TaxID=51655 RepID=A0A8S4DMG2_PLUXY|nr:unnamed protein product [Plutella xylostella]
MYENKVLDGISAIDNAVYAISRDREVKTTIDILKYFKNEKQIEDKLDKKTSSRIEASDVSHYFTLAILAASSWGLLYCAFGSDWRWDGPWSRLALVAAVAWGGGRLLQATTTLPALLAALATGIVATNLDFLDMRDYSEVDVFLRKIYPVVILGKASLGWNVNYMRTEWKRVVSLGSLPWAAEVAAVTVSTHLLLGFPWLWGVLLGSIYASVSCAVVMPSVARQQRPGCSRNWPQLVCTAGGVDTALSVGVYGLVYSYMFVNASDVYKYVKVTASSWGLLYCAFGSDWRWDGPWSRLALVAAVAWGGGRLLQATTTLPALLAALATGIVATNLDFLDMRDYSEVDVFLRKIYPVVILGKASLGWNVNYMRTEWKRVVSLGSLPWAAEVAAVTVSTHLLLGFPWLWGVLLGSIYASVSCAVVMPSVARQQRPGCSRNWPQLVCTAGGVDTALSVGVYGLVYSYMFVNASDVYKYVKAALTLFVGVALGVGWGSLARVAPHRDDAYVTELRILLVLLGGLLGNFGTMLLGWGGVGGVAVLACNATAAHHWARAGWALNKNPAATAYRVAWAALEPMVFAYSGTFFKIDASTWDTLLLGLGVLAVSLGVRLAVTWVVCVGLSTRERLYVCAAWVPKSIVPAVLCPLAIDTLLPDVDDPRMEYAETLMRLLVQLIIITTPLGFLLTDRLGSWLLAGEGNTEPKRNSCYGVESEET